MSFKAKDADEAELLKRFLKIPYKHRGRSFRGSDCYGLIILWYKWQLGLPIWDIDEKYDENWSFKTKNYFVENYHREWIKVDVPEIYDVILFKRNDMINHAGIYLNDNYFLHVLKAGCVISRLSDPEWESKVIGFYHLKARA